MLRISGLGDEGEYNIEAVFCFVFGGCRRSD